ncbi:MAG: hypothetical protein AB1649_26575 [Chloroflexota bacterium]
MKTKSILLLVVSLFVMSCALLPAGSATAEGNPAAETPVLLFTIGMHIEPMGETAQGYQSGQGDYANENFFNRHVENILTLAEIVEAHGGVMTIQAQSPFTTQALETGNTVLADLATAGHEMALHFHEDAHLGRQSETLPVELWCAAMGEEIGYITEASGVIAEDIRYWSGGNLYPDLFEAAACAGLDVNSDWKNPRTQSTDLSLTGIHPWRPAGGTDGYTFDDFAAHDPDGAVVFLPEGGYDKQDFAASRRSDETGGDEAYFEYLRDSLYASLEMAEAGKVNVFHFTVHPGEFRGDMDDPFGVIERFMAEVVDPLVESGQVQWATFGQMADAYIAWETDNPGTDPRE